MKTFNCPDCLFDNFIDGLDLCGQCKRIVGGTYKPYNPYWSQDNYDNGDPCKNCSNNPKNGGSGVCNCTLPYYYGKGKITC
jgi:hypothetical protein